MLRVSHETAGQLFPDTELGEDLAEHVLDIEPAGEPAERIGGLAQVLGGKLGGSPASVQARSEASAVRARSISCRWRARVMSGVSAAV